MNLLFDILADVLSIFWLDLIMVLIGGTVVYFSLHPYHIPKIHFMDINASYDNLPPYDSNEETLYSMGYLYLARYKIDMQKGSDVEVREFASPDRTHSVLLTRINTGSGFKDSIDINTDFFPTGNITTNNARLSSGDIYPNQKFVARAPWLKDIQSLIELHTELCQAARCHGITAKTVDLQSLQARVEDDIIRDCEYEVHVGRMKKSHKETYRFTILGALWATYKVWTGMINRILFFWYRPRLQTLKKWLHRRFNRVPEFQRYSY